MFHQSGKGFVNARLWSTPHNLECFTAAVSVRRLGGVNLVIAAPVYPVGGIPLHLVKALLTFSNFLGYIFAAGVDAKRRRPACPSTPWGRLEQASARERERRRCYLRRVGA